MTLIRILRAKNPVTEFFNQHGIYICDQCGLEFEGSYYIRNRKQHYHSPECTKLAKSVGGNAYKIRIQNSNQKHGVEWPQQLPEVVQKMKDTNIERFGVECSVHAPEIKRQIEENYLQQYGVKHQFAATEVKDKIKATMLDRYGVENYTQTPEYVENVDWKLASQKRHETKKRNGTYGTSIPEELYYKRLVDQFGVADVERHVLVNDWDIDFYIKSIDVFVQHDGSYYHGLDRPIEIIKEFKTESDEVIYATWLRDHKQRKWFAEQGKFLMRIVDYEE